MFIVNTTLVFVEVHIKLRFTTDRNTIASSRVSWHVTSRLRSSLLYRNNNMAAVEDATTAMGDMKVADEGKVRAISIDVLCRKYGAGSRFYSVL